jgi:hypothetical protein
MKLYFWCQLRRVTGKSDKPHQWYATVGTDAETTGRFDDSITYVGYDTLKGNQSESSLASRFKHCQISYGHSIGFDHCLIVSITEKEYENYKRELSDWSETMQGS